MLDRDTCECNYPVEGQCEPDFNCPLNWHANLETCQCEQQCPDTICGKWERINHSDCSCVPHDCDKVPETCPPGAHFDWDACFCKGNENYQEPEKPDCAPISPCPPGATWDQESCVCKGNSCKIECPAFLGLVRSPEECACIPARDCSELMKDECMIGEVYSCVEKRCVAPDHCDIQVCPHPQYLDK